MADTTSTTLITQTQAQSRVGLFTPARVRTFLSYVVLTIGGIISLIPFLWMIFKSVMSLGDSMGAAFFPTELHLENYVEAWEIGNFSEYFVNSILITVITLVGELTFSILAAYAFARIDFPGKNIFFGMLLITLMIPAMVTTIPNLLIVTWLGRVGPLKWLNNWPALTIPFMGSVFSIFLLRQFFAQIPEELYDAAQIDGAGHLRFLAQIVLPLSKAPIMVIIVLSFIGSWNSLAWPLLVTTEPEWRPIAVGLMNFVNEAGQQVNLMMAGAFITILPILVMYFFTQKQFTESISRSGIKG
ncbi:MAG TPA: carbohydrate ABC transporter permease [Anaerolineales bacterium]|nr:carbohydrate ABC transporter permease [Anaerolineales bacterium]